MSSHGLEKHDRRQCRLTLIQKIYGRKQRLKALRLRFYDSPRTKVIKTFKGVSFFHEQQHHRFFHPVEGSLLEDMGCSEITVAKIYNFYFANQYLTNISRHFVDFDQYHTFFNPSISNLLYIQKWQIFFVRPSLWNFIDQVE